MKHLIFLLLFLITVPCLAIQGSGDATLTHLTDEAITLPSGDEWGLSFKVKTPNNTLIDILEIGNPKISGDGYTFSVDASGFPTAYAKNSSDATVEVSGGVINNEYDADAYISLDETEGGPYYEAFNNTEGTENNSTYISTISGKQGNGINVSDSGDSYIDFGTAATLGDWDAETDFSISFWFRSSASSLGLLENICGRGNYGSTWAPGWNLTGDSDNLRFIMAKTTSAWYYTFLLESGLQADTWYHIVVRHNTSYAISIGTDRFTSFINGAASSNRTRIGAGSSFSDIDLSSYSFRIGEQISSFDMFDGDIDEIYLFDRVITTDEVTSLYSEGSPGSGGGVTALNDGSYHDIYINSTGSTLELYMDSTLTDSETFIGGVFTDIDTHFFKLSFPSEVSIQDIRLYPKSLSSDDITSIHNGCPVYQHNPTVWIPLIGQDGVYLPSTINLFDADYYIPFDEADGPDHSEVFNSVTGTESDTTDTTTQTGIQGNCVHNDGVDNGNAIIFSSPGNMGNWSETDDFSISFWGKSNSSSYTSSVLMMRANSTNRYSGWSIYIASQLFTVIMADASFHYYLVKPPFIGEGTQYDDWQHYVVTHDASESSPNAAYRWKVYINGTDATTAYVVSGTCANVDNSSYSFEVFGSTYNSYDGCIDEIYFFDGKVLNQAEVAALYNAGNPDSGFGENTIQGAIGAGSLDASGTFTQEAGIRIRTGGGK